MKFIDLLEQNENILNQFANEVKRDLDIDFFIKDKPVETPPFQFGVLPVPIKRGQ